MGGRKKWEGGREGEVGGRNRREGGKEESVCTSWYDKALLCNIMHFISV